METEDLFTNEPLETYGVKGYRIYKGNKQIGYVEGALAQNASSAKEGFDEQVVAVPVRRLEGNTQSATESQTQLF